MGSFRAWTAVVMTFGVLALGACGGGDDTGGDEVTLEQGAVTKNLEAAGYAVDDAEPGQTALPSLVDADFATGSDSGFTGAVQVSGNGLAPFDPSDVSKTGFILFYDDADDAAAADEGIGSGEGQVREGNALFVYGTGLDPVPPEFQDMIDAAEGS